MKANVSEGGTTDGQGYATHIGLNPSKANVPILEGSIDNKAKAKAQQSPSGEYTIKM